MGDPYDDAMLAPLGLQETVPGLAQASQSAAGTSLMDGTASRVISDDAIETHQRAAPRQISSKHRASQQRLQGRGFLRFRPKPLEDHLVGVTRRAGALV